MFTINVNIKLFIDILDENKCKNSTMAQQPSEWTSSLSHISFDRAQKTFDVIQLQTMLFNHIRNASAFTSNAWETLARLGKTFQWRNHFDAFSCFLIYIENTMARWCKIFATRTNCQFLCFWHMLQITNNW